MDNREYSELSKEGALNAIKDFLLEQMALSIRESRKKEAFGKAAWPYYQAMEIGQQRAIQKILNYLPESVYKE